MGFLLFVFVFCDGSPHLTLKTKFGSLVSYPSRNISDSVAGFVQLIEIHSRFLVHCIMGRCAGRWPQQTRTGHSQSQLADLAAFAFRNLKEWMSRSRLGMVGSGCPLHPHDAQPRIKV